MKEPVDHLRQLTRLRMAAQRVVAAHDDVQSTAKCRRETIIALRQLLADDSAEADPGAAE
jgi:hypothetical protein